MNQTIKLLLFATSLSFTACSNTEQKQQSATTTAPEVTATPIAASTGKITDPVCGMEKDSTWTDYTVYKGDTVWFCAASEKDAFIAAPQKYEKNLPHHQ